MIGPIPLGEWKNYTPEQVDDAVDEWHTGESDLPMWSYLGMSFAEYGDWLTGGIPARTKEKEQ